MMVPTGRAFLATSTLGPTATVGAAAAAACWAPAPANIFLAMMAVTTAMTSAPTSRASFFTSMARSPPLEGLPEQPYKSGKMVKKRLGEIWNENGETAQGDRDTIRNFRTSLATPGPVPGKHSHCKNASGNRHQD